MRVCVCIDRMSSLYAICVVVGLSKHLVTHPEYRNDPNFKGAELFTCPVCEKLFTRENYLERHMEMKHDEEHARAYEIYKQKYIRKPQPVPVENSDQAVPVMDGPHSSSLSQAALPSRELKENHMSPPFPIDSTNQGTVNTVRPATISRPPPESPSDSEIEDSSRRKESLQQQQQQQQQETRGMMPSHSESFHSDTSFERSSPSRQSVHGKMDGVVVGGGAPVGHWNSESSHSARASPRVLSDPQHQPYDMSKTHPPAPVRSASVSLPVFPDSFERHMKDKDSPGDPNLPRNQVAQKSYLYRHMASVDEEQLRSAITNYGERGQISQQDPHQVSYDQFVRDQMIDEPHRTSEKADSFSQRNGNKQGVSSRGEHYLTSSSSEPDDRRVNDNFFSPPPGPQRPVELTNHRPDTYMERNNHRGGGSGLSKTSPPDSNTHLHEDLSSHIDRHFPYSRSPAHGQDHPRGLLQPPTNEDGTRYDYAPHYNPAHGLLSPGHGSLSRERFPFNLPPSSLPPASFPHPMSPRPALSSQYPALGHRSEEEVAQALESLARAMRPAYR